MPVLIALGMLSALFFSSTFILNRLMSLEHGHWVWSASLRYFFMIAMVVAVISLYKGIPTLLGVFKLFRRYWRFWVISGSIGFGGFYSLLCYSADFAQGWVIATTWQFTVIASLFVLMAFGKHFPKRIWFFCLLILAGVGLVNVSSLESFHLEDLLKGALPVLIAAFCYPIGNQLVWEARHHRHARIPHIEDPLLHNPFHKVLLLSLGSLPFWIVLILFTHPPLPSSSQLLSTAMVALLSGIVATTLFLLARNRAKTSSEIAAVDATQASEVVFALLGEMLFLGAPLPSLSAFIGIGCVFTGLFLFIAFQKEEH
jgi:drug/metabolite transporter (DMT)-like permease